ncbi:hypothetical protein ACLB2K_045257 [Fragaria x ananassa]
MPTILQSIEESWKKHRLDRRMRESFYQSKRAYGKSISPFQAKAAGEVLLIYLLVSTAAISSVLIREEEKHEEAIYYVSKGFADAEFRYPEIEKLALSLITSARKLNPYFQTHTIEVMTNQPLKQVLWKPETSGRLDPIWTLYIDESSNQAGSGASLVLTTPQNDELEYTFRFNFKACNNEVKYEALIAGLRIAKELESTKVQVHSDFQHVVNQVLEEYQAKDPVMAAYLSKVKSLLSCFTSYDIVQIPREQNERADALARLASAIDRNMGKNTLIKYLNKPSIEEERETLQIDDIPS